MAYRVRR